MIDPIRSLDEIKTSLQHTSIDLNGVKGALRDLCDHLIAQKAEIDANRAEIAQRPTMGQTVAMSMGDPLNHI